jgi:hypothetical protein
MGYTFNGCPAGSDNCVFRVGVYVDGNAIPGSGRDVTVVPATNGFAQPGPVSMIQQLTAGTHTFAMGFKQTSGPAATPNLLTRSFTLSGPFVQ